MYPDLEKDTCPPGAHRKGLNQGMATEPSPNLRAPKGARTPKTARLLTSTAADALQVERDDLLVSRVADSARVGGIGGARLQGQAQRGAIRGQL